LDVVAEEVPEPGLEGNARAFRVWITGENFTNGVKSTADANLRSAAPCGLPTAYG
jgi:hypothetical protein